MKHVKNTVFYILLFSALTSNALCMEEKSETQELTEKMEHLSLDLKAGVNALSESTDTPLIRACFNDNLPLAQYLVEHKANINSQNKDGASALITACYNGNLPLVEFLVENGANINMKDNEGFTPLLQSCDKNYTDIAEYLIKCNAEINVKNNDGETPLTLACRYSNLELIKLLIQKGAAVDAQYINDENEKTETPLIIACGKGNTELARFLINKGANVNVANKSGYTPLIIACDQGNYNLVKLLLHKGANVNKKGPNGNTALHEACFNCSVKIVELLLENKANVNCHKSIAGSITFEKKLKISTANWTPLTYVVAMLGLCRLNSDDQLIIPSSSNRSYKINKKQVHKKQACSLIKKLLDRGAILNLESYKLLIKSKTCNLQLQKLIRNLKDQNTLTELHTYAIKVGNEGAQKIISEKIKVNEAKNIEKPQKPAPIYNRRKRQFKRGKNRNNNKKQEPQNDTPPQPSTKFTLEECKQVADAFKEVSYDPTTKQVTVNPDFKKDITVFSDSKDKCVFTYDGLIEHGGNKLIMTVFKNNKPKVMLQSKFDHGCDISLRARSGKHKLSSKRKLSSKAFEAEEAEEWNDHPDTLKNPKMNNPKDPTHAFPEYVERNFAQWAVNITKEKVVSYDKRDLPKAVKNSKGEIILKAKKLSDYDYKLVFEIPGSILAKIGNDTQATLLKGNFEYVILVPKGTISANNRPLCVHRFFRKN